MKKVTVPTEVLTISLAMLLSLTGVATAQLANPVVWPANGIASQANPNASLGQQFDVSGDFELRSVTVVVNDGNVFRSPDAYILEFRLYNDETGVLLNSQNIDLGSSERPNQFPEPEWYETIAYDPPIFVSTGRYRLEVVSPSGRGGLYMEDLATNSYRATRSGADVGYPASINYEFDAVESESPFVPIECHLESLDGLTFGVKCPEDAPNTLPDYLCTVSSDENGTYTLTSADGSSVSWMDGAEGQRGPAGVDGAEGQQGLVGADGAQGPIGPEGPQGLVGADGAQGPIGPEGPQGLVGADGAQGPIGPEGPQGLVGADGVQGPAGADGAQGPIGPEGPQGPAGIGGITGPMGPPGQPGLDGAQGPEGPRGPEGPMGAVGLDGPAGSSCTVSTAMGNGASILCDDGSEASIINGANGESCTLANNGDGTSTLTCPDGSSVRLATVSDEGPVSPCSVEQSGNGAVIRCLDGTEAELMPDAASSDGCNVSPSTGNTAPLGIFGLLLGSLVIRRKLFR